MPITINDLPEFDIVLISHYHLDRKTLMECGQYDEFIALSLHDWNDPIIRARKASKS